MIIYKSFDIIIVFFAKLNRNIYHLIDDESVNFFVIFIRLQKKSLC